MSLAYLSLGRAVSALTWTEIILRAGNSKSDIRRAREPATQSSLGLVGDVDLAISVASEGRHELGYLSHRRALRTIGFRTRVGIEAE